VESRLIAASDRHHPMDHNLMSPVLYLASPRAMAKVCAADLFKVQELYSLVWVCLES
jgi:hypothetical protein